MEAGEQNSGGGDGAASTTINTGRSVIRGDREETEGGRGEIEEKEETEGDRGDRGGLREIEQTEGD